MHPDTYVGYSLFEYIPGEDLVDYVVKSGHLKTKQARHIFRQVLSAVGMYC